MTIEAKPKGKRGGRRPGAGRPRKHPKPITGADLSVALRREFMALRVDEDRQVVRMLAAEMKRLAEGQANIEQLLQRHLLAMRRELGVAEDPRTPRINRRRPLE